MAAPIRPRPEYADAPASGEYAAETRALPDSAMYVMALAQAMHGCAAGVQRAIDDGIVSRNASVICYRIDVEMGPEHHTISGMGRG